MRIITFSKFDEHSSPIFKSLNIIKLFDLVTLSIAIFMFKFKKKLLPSIINTLFITVNEVHIIIQDPLQSSLFICLKQEQIMGFSISDFEAQKYGIQSPKKLNYSR